MTRQKDPTPLEEQGLVLTIEEVTPAIAGDWLATNTHNRPLRDYHVQDLARQMEAGEWALNGEAIKFNSAGVLVDGQHRLTASIVSDTTFRTVVVRHAPPNSFETIDSGKKRTLGDALALSGETSWDSLAATISLHWRYIHRQMVGAVLRPSTAQCLLHLEAHPELRTAVKTAARASSKARCPVSVLSVAWYLFQPLDREAADAFMHSLAEGAGLKPTDPILRLRERFTSNRDARLKLSTPELLALTIKAWNLWRTGREVQNLSWRFRGGEAFPEAQG